MLFLDWNHDTSWEIAVGSSTHFSGAGQMSTLQETVSSEKIDTNLLSRFSCDLLRFLEDLDEAWVTYF